MQTLVMINQPAIAFLSSPLSISIAEVPQKALPIRAMSGNSPDTAGTPAGAVEGHHRFSGRVLLTTVLSILALIVVFVFIPLLLYVFGVRSAAGGRGRGRGGLAAGIRRSMISSFGRISRRRGLDASALSALPVTAYRKKKQERRAGASAGGGGPDSDCAVCLSELADGDKVRELPNCGHVFHVECVDAWLRSRTTCPLCRAGAEPETELKGNGKEEAAQSSSSSSSAAATGPPQPALSGPGGGSFIVTVHGFPDTRRDAPGSTSGAVQLVSSYS